jgi:hypothetical protein
VAQGVGPEFKTKSIKKKKKERKRWIPGDKIKAVYRKKRTGQEEKLDWFRH